MCFVHFSAHLLKLNKEHTQGKKEDSKMVLSRSACLVLGLLLTYLALRDSVVHAQKAPDKAIVTNENDGIAITGVDAVFFSKELFNGVPSTATTNKRLGGRKVLQGSNLWKNMMEEEAVDGKTPKFSGKGKKSSKKPLGTLQKYMNDQKSSNILKPKALNSAPWDGKQNPDLPADTVASQLKSQDSDQVVSKCGSLECSSSSSRKIVSPEFHDHYYKTVSKKLRGATNDMVMSLMHKDYSGRPHCKPPINNRQPSLNSVKP